MAFGQAAKAKQLKGLRSGILGVLMCVPIFCCCNAHLVRLRLLCIQVCRVCSSRCPHVQTYHSTRNGTGHCFMEKWRCAAGSKCHWKAHRWKYSRSPACVINTWICGPYWLERVVAVQNSERSLESFCARTSKPRNRYKNLKNVACSHKAVFQFFIVFHV